MTQQQETGCVLRLFGAQSTAVGKTVENFRPSGGPRPSGRAGAGKRWWPCRRRAFRLKRRAGPAAGVFGRPVRGRRDHSACAVVEALERHDKLLICADAAAGALLEARLENLPGAEKVLILAR